MVLLQRRVHPCGLSLQVKEEIYVKRRVDKKSWEQIAGEVRNRRGKHPDWKVVRAAFRELSGDRDLKQRDKYSKFVWSQSHSDP